jgi:hypothetical protein
MKKSVNFNSKRSQQKRYGNTRAFINLAKWCGMPDNEIIESVKRTAGFSEPKPHEHIFNADGICICGMTKSFLKETP